MPTLRRAMSARPRSARRTPRAAGPRGRGLHTEAGVFHGMFQAGYAAGSDADVHRLALCRAHSARCARWAASAPSLAEDHSTSMLLSAGGWRGVHRAGIPSRWATGRRASPISARRSSSGRRSLLSLLLSHTARYLPTLPPRLKFQFVFCQMWYPLFAVFMLVLYLMPIAAIVFDMRFADVTYPAFVFHAIWPATHGHADGLRDPGGRLFSAPATPGAGLGKGAVSRDPSGPGCCGAAPWRCAPVSPAVSSISASTTEGRGGRGAAAAAGGGALCRSGAGLHPARAADRRGGGGARLLLPHVAERHCLRRHHHGHRHPAHSGQQRPARPALTTLPLQILTLPLLAVLVVSALVFRGPESILALSVGLVDADLVTYEYVVSGAGMGGSDNVRFRWDPDFWRNITGQSQEEDIP